MAFSVKVAAEGLKRLEPHVAEPRHSPLYVGVIKTMTPSFLRSHISQTFKKNVLISCIYFQTLCIYDLEHHQCFTSTAVCCAYCNIKRYKL